VAMGGECDKLVSLNVTPGCHGWPLLLAPRFKDKKLRSERSVIENILQSSSCDVIGARGIGCTCAGAQFMSTGGDCDAPASLLVAAACRGLRRDVLLLVAPKIDDRKLRSERSDCRVRRADMASSRPRRRAAAHWTKNRARARTRAPVARPGGACS